MREWKTFGYCVIAMMLLVVGMVGLWRLGLYAHGDTTDHYGRQGDRILAPTTTPVSIDDQIKNWR